MATHYHDKVGGFGVVLSIAVIHSLVWMELHVPGWEGWVLVWSMVLWVAVAAVRFAAALFRLLK